MRIGLVAVLLLWLAPLAAAGEEVAAPAGAGETAPPAPPSSESAPAAPATGEAGGADEAEASPPGEPSGEPPAGHLAVLLPPEGGFDAERLREFLAARVEDLGYRVTVESAPGDGGLGGQVDAAREAGRRLAADAVVWLHPLGGDRLLVLLFEGGEERIIARDLETASGSPDDALETLAIIVRSVLRAHVTLTAPPPAPPAPAPAAEAAPPADEAPSPPAPPAAAPPRRTPVAWPRGGVGVMLQGFDGAEGSTLIGGYIGVDLRITDLVRAGVTAWILPASEATSDAGLEVSLTRVPIEVTASLAWQLGPVWAGLRLGLVLDPLSATSSTEVRQDSFEYGAVLAATLRYALVDRIWIEADGGLDLFATEHHFVDPAAEQEEVLTFPTIQARFTLGLAVDVP